MKKALVYALAAAVLVAGHVLLAPATVEGMGRVKDAYGDWKADRQTARFTERLEGVPPGARPDVMDGVESLHDWLAVRGKDLTVVLLPTRVSLLEEEDKPFQKPSPAAKRLDALSKALAGRKIAHVNLLGRGYFHVIKEPHDVFRDRIHFATGFETKIAEELAVALPARSGRLFVGDCFADTLPRAIQKVAPAVPLKSFWKNNGASTMAFEVSRLSEDEIKDVKEVVWVVPDFSLAEKASPFAKCSPPGAPGEKGAQVLYAQLVQATEVAASLNDNSTYDDALAVHKFRARDGTFFLGIARVMSKRTLDEAVRRWRPGMPLRLQVTDWDTATTANKTLRNIQMIDDVQDFVLPRYYIEGWLNDAFSASTQP